MNQRFWDFSDKTTRAKICNITSLEAAYNLWKYGADALGFHIKNTGEFNKKLELCVSIIPVIKKISGISCWVLTDIYDQEILESIIVKTTADCIQFQGKHDMLAFAEMVSYLRDKTDVKIVKTVSVFDGNFDSNTVLISGYAQAADAILFDTRWEKGGTGAHFDYSLAKNIIKNIHKPFFIAGGLNENNVADVIAELRPFGVDVQSGVEEILFGETGKKRVKDFNKCKSFIEKCKANL